MRVNGKRVYSRNPAFVIRDAEMILMFRDGKTLQQIGDKFGITRERVRQRLNSLGLSAVDGGACFRRLAGKMDAAKRQDEIAAAKEQRHFDRWGISLEECERITQAVGVPRSSGKHPIRAFERQRMNAKHRGIAWEMDFSEWWGVWQESGHWNERGRGYGYCMARWADDGPYSVENVYICTGAQNCSDSYITKPAVDRAAKAHLTRLAKLSSKPLHSSAASSAPQ